MNDAEIRAKVDVSDGGGFLRIGSNVKVVDRQVQLLRSKIDDLRVGIQQMESMPKDFGKTEILSAKAELERLENQYTSLTTTNEKTTTSVSKGWEKGTRNIGRFLFNMFAVGSAFALVAKASRSYLETNDEAQAQTEITANTMGQLLAPAMKVVLDMTQYLVIGFALLIKMFTGYDALAKVTTKNIKKTSDATKDLNKQLTAMDEIQNLSDPMGGAGITGLQADLKALDDFNDKIKTVQELFDKWDVQGFVNKLKDLWKWIVDNKEALILFGKQAAIIFGTASIGAWLLNIGKLIGTAGTGAAAAGGTGLAGLLGVLLAIAAIGSIVTSITTIYRAVKEGEAATKAGVGVSVSTAKKSEQQTASIKGTGYEPEFINKLQDQLKSAKSELDKAVKNYETASKSPLFLLRKNMLQDVVDMWGIQYGSLKKNIESLGGVPKYANGGVLTKATLGIAGEYSGASSNPEIISPQSLMKDTMIEAFSQILPMMNQSRGDAILNVNGRDLARATFGDFEYEGNRLGKTSTVVRRVV